MSQPLQAHLVTASDATTEPQSSQQNSAAQRPDPTEAAQGVLPANARETVSIPDLQIIDLLLDDETVDRGLKLIEQRFFRVMVGEAYRSLGSNGTHDDAEDIVEEVMVELQDRIRRRMENGKSISNLRGFVRWAVDHKCRDWLRKNTRSRNRLRELHARLQEAAPQGTDLTQDELSGSLSVYRLINVVLSDKVRDAFILRHMQGCSYEEIGILLNLKPTTAKVYVSLARRELKDYLLTNGHVID